MWKVKDHGKIKVLRFLATVTRGIRFLNGRLIVRFHDSWETEMSERRICNKYSSHGMDGGWGYFVTIVYAYEARVRKDYWGQDRGNFKE
jgi:hypothetical protein